MIHGGNNDNRTWREIRQKRIADNGGCTHCRPHRGENDRGRKHGRWVYGDYENSHDFHVNGFIPSKSKNRK